MDTPNSGATTLTPGSGTLDTFDRIQRSPSADLPGAPPELQSLLQTLPFFSGAEQSDEFIQEISKLLHIRKYSPGDVVINQGETARSMFLIIKGSLKVTSENGEIDVADLAPGTFCTQF